MANKIKCYAYLDEDSYDESPYVYLDWENILSQTTLYDWNGLTYTTCIPAGARDILIKDDGSFVINVIDLRLLLDNLSNGGVNISKLNLKASRYLNDIQGYNSIVVYKGWFCRVDSCGRVILCTEQEAYDRGLLVR